VTRDRTRPKQLDLEIAQFLATAPAPRLEPAPVISGPRKPRRYKPDIAYPAELTQEEQHFASGVNHPGEIRGLGMSARNFGITATRCNAKLLAELEQFAFNGGPRLFVDSGAFSEVAFGPGGPRVVKLITDAEWRKRLALYEKLAAMYRTRCYLVAPDQVGNQAVTLERLQRYAPQIRACAAQRANIIVPIQKGDLPMSEMYAQALAILRLQNDPHRKEGASTFIAGVPMKKDATSLEQLRELVGGMPWYGARIHLLGLGPESKRFTPAIRAIKALRPNASITSDSVTVRRLAGKTNGPGGGPRALTKYMAQADAAGWGGNDARGRKAYALSMQGADEARRDVERARAAGWRDVELDDDEGDL
jgi:hypothetical protein